MAEAAQAELECPVCYELPDGVVYQCTEGHCFCASCNGRIADRLCPICREELPERPSRNRFFEQQIAKLTTTCGHCGAATTRGEKEAHERSCPQRPRTCAGAEAGCAWTGLVAEQPAHEAACPYAVCQRVVAPLRAQVAELVPQNQRLRDRVAALEPQVAELVPENARLRARVAALEGEEGGRRQRQRVGPAPHDAPPAPHAAAPTNLAIGRMDLAAAAAALRAHMADARVAAKAVEQLRKLCMVFAALEPAAAAGVIEMAAEALETHPQAVEVQKHACHLLYYVCRDDEGDAAGLARKQRAADAGVIELAVAAMRAYPRDTAVQEEAISALFGACCNEDGMGIPERVTRMMDAGAWPLVERARRATFTPSLLAVMRLQR